MLLTLGSGTQKIYTKKTQHQEPHLHMNPLFFQQQRKRFIIFDCVKYVFMKSSP